MNVISRFNCHKIWLLGILLFISVGVRLPGLFSRAIWYDEAITLLETAGNALPSWPKKPVPARTAKKLFVGDPTLSKIAQDLRQTDIHPPVYYWLLSLWRRYLGFSLETARAFSLVCSIGTVLALYLLLQAGKIERPFVHSLVFAISSGAIFAGHEARSYALASLMIVIVSLFSYLASKSTHRNQTCVLIYSISMALCCGIAFQIHYLTLFPVCVILLWFLINLWSVSRLLAIMSPLIAVSIWLVGFPSFLAQLGKRSHQEVGFIGIFPEMVKILKMNSSVIWTPIFKSTELKFFFIEMLIILITTSTVYVLRHWSETNRKFLLLFIGLALAPSIGLILLDLLFNKNLCYYRYLIFAGPALAVIITYGITRPIFSKQPILRFLLPILLGLQIAGINWGFERSPHQPGSDLRSFANSIKLSSLPSHIVVIGEGFGCGHPGSVIYELDPETMIVVLSKDSNLEELQFSIQNYDDIWIVFSTDRQTATIENELLNRLQKSGYYEKILRRQFAIHLRKSG